MAKQKTLKQSIETTGVGVHTGDKVKISLRPAPVNTGIIFRRIDLNPAVEIPATIDFVNDTTLCTCLAQANAKVATVEHLLAALAGLGIDNLYIDVSAPEIPVMDGSAAPFLFLLQSAGFETQAALKKFIRVKEKVTVIEGDKWVSLEPHHGFSLDLTIDYDHPVFNDRPQHAFFEFSTAAFVKEVSRARTFGLLEDYERLRAMNLASGASLDNTVVVDHYRILNEGGLRYDDEFVKHKILDAIGDLYLLGAPVLGAFRGYKSGHRMNQLLLQALLANQSAFEIVTFANEKTAPVMYQRAAIQT